MAHPARSIFAFALVVRIALLGLFSTSPHFGVQSGDMRFYHDWALRIASGQWTDGHAFYGLPGYAYLLAAIYKLFGVHPAIMFGFQAVADASTAAIVFRLTSRVVPAQVGYVNESLVWGVLAALGWICFVPAQVFAAVLMPTVLAAACYWCCVERAASTQLGGRPWLSFGLGVLVGFMAMAVATVLFAVPLLLASVVRSSASWARRFACAGLLLAGLFTGSAPASLHNRLVAREPVFLSAHGGINFWIGNAPGANGYPKIPAGLRAGQQELLIDSVTVAQKESGRTLTRAEVSEFWSAKSWANIRKSPGTWMRLLCAKVKNFWSAFSYDDVSIIPLLREEGVLFPGIAFGVAATVGLFGLVVALVTGLRGKGTIHIGWIVAGVFGHLLALLPVFITERYRLAAVPGLLVLGAFGLACFFRSVQERPWLLTCASLLGFVGAAAFVYQPAPTFLLSGMEPYNLAISELEVGQLDRAEKHLQEAAAHAPENAAILFARGTLSLKQRDLLRAKKAFEASLLRGGENADAYTNLGIIACSEQHWPVAVGYFQKALRLQPGDAQVQQLLDMARLKL